MRFPRRSLATLTLLAASSELVNAFSVARGTHRNIVQQRQRGRLYVSSTTEEATKEEVVEPSTDPSQSDEIVQQKRGILSKINEKIGIVDEDRIIFPEYDSGEVDRMFTSLEYTKTEEGKIAAARAAGSVVGAASLVAGTTVRGLTNVCVPLKDMVHTMLLTAFFVFENRLELVY